MTSIEMHGYKQKSPYFVARLFDNEQLIHTARCKTNYHQHKISVEDNLGNQGSVYITFNVEADMHNLLETWYNAHSN